MSDHEEKNLLWPLKMYRYRHGTQRWKHLPRDYGYEKRTAPNRIKILTWNIDFTSPHAIERMQGAMTFLQGVLEDPPIPCVILLQEVHEQALPYLLEVDWIQRYFLVTPASKVKWNGEGLYGLVTLVEKSIPVLHSSIVHFARSIMTDMDRAMVMTDIKLKIPGQEEEDLVVRIANVHFESRGYSDAADMRKAQLRFCSWIIQNEDEKYPFDGGVVAGDFNAIDPDSDKQVVEGGFIDLGRQTQGEYTWGVNGTNREGYPPGRLDKIVFTPDRGFRMTTPERVGVGLTLEIRGREMCVSDHCALSSDLEVLRDG